MAVIARVRIGFDGLIGLPGVSTFYCLEPIGMIEPLKTLYTTLLLRMPLALTSQVETAGDFLEATTGTITGAWSAASTLPASGSAAGVYAAPVGLCLTWTTGTITDGKRVKGRTFVVPMSQNVYGADGSAENTNLTAIRDAAAAFQVATSGNLVVWHRPRAARAADGSRPAVVARAGSHAVVTGSFVRDKIAVLRSRRD